MASHPRAVGTRHISVYLHHPFGVSLFVGGVASDSMHDLLGSRNLRGLGHPDVSYAR